MAAGRNRLSKNQARISQGGAPLASQCGRRKRRISVQSLFSVRDGQRMARLAVAGMAMAVAVALLAPAGRSFAQDMPKPPNPNSLYNRMGGYDIIAAVVDGFINQMKKDPAFKRFGEGRSIGSKVVTRQMIVDQLCNLTGGPCVYFGRDMKSAHRGLDITNAEWNSAIEKLKVALNEQKVKEPEQKEFIAIIQSFRRDIVQPPAKMAGQGSAKTKK
jgi:hemoglobin